MQVQHNNVKAYSKSKRRVLPQIMLLMISKNVIGIYGLIGVGFSPAAVGFSLVGHSPLG